MKHLSALNPQVPGLQVVVKPEILINIKNRNELIIYINEILQQIGDGLLAAVEQLWTYEGDDSQNIIVPGAPKVADFDKMKKLLEGGNGGEGKEDTGGEDEVSPEATQGEFDKGIEEDEG